MTNKSKARHGIRGTYRFKLNPTTRAIRNAFALGLALAATAPVAMAGTCDIDVSNAPASAGIYCDGSFTSSVDYSAFGIDDLTVIFGGDLPTVVIGSLGFDAISIYSDVGNIDLTNYADVIADGGNGITVFAPNGDATVTNYGDVVSLYGNGIQATTFQGDATVTNYGEVLAVAAAGSDYDISGIGAASKYGDAYVNNTAGSSVSAVSLYGSDAHAIGINAYSKYGYANVNNDGEVEASTMNGVAYGISASGYAGAGITVGETGTVVATAGAYGSAGGVFAYSYDGNATVTNSGDISAVNNGTGLYSDGYAVGAAAGSYNGNAYIVNNGSISASNSTKYGTAAGAASASYYGNAYITNNDGGSISALSSGADGTAIGAYAYSFQGDATVTNNVGGSIDATTTGKYSTATGAIAHAGYAAYLYNYGSISASATYDGVLLLGDVHATGAAVTGTQATLENAEYASISANAYVYAGYATAVGSAVNADIDGTTDNHGDISATAGARYGYDYGLPILPAVDVTAIGSVTNAYNANLYNYGNIDANASVGYGNSYAVGSLVLGHYAFTLNEGTISAEAYADEGDATAVGSSTYGKYSISTSMGSGTTSAYASVGDGNASATGAYVYGKYSSELRTYAGTSISATAYAFTGTASAIGSNVAAETEYGTASTYNGGTISADASAKYGDAVAIGSATTGYYASLENPGDISASASVFEGTAEAMGAFVNGYYADTNNSGNSITAYAYAYTGTAKAYGSETLGIHASLENTGDISATAVAINGDSIAAGSVVEGKYADTNNGEGGSISGSAYSYAGDAMSWGTYTLGTYADTVNYGSVSADASVVTGTATAIGARTNGGYANLYNYNDISATATAYAGIATATGSLTTGSMTAGYVGSTYNAGSISADASVTYGAAYANGAVTKGYDANLYNHGDISATAYVYDGLAVAVGSNVYGVGALAANYEYGSISAEATAYYGGAAEAVGSWVNSPFGYASQTNYGEISATANAPYGAAIAFAVNVYGMFGATLTNYGDGTISAEANAYSGVAEAVGSDVHSKYVATTTNYGSISAVANADYGVAEAIGSATQADGKYYNSTNYSGSAALFNHGDISATANAAGGDAIAIGAAVNGSAGEYANGYVGAKAYNSGSISATANGYNAVATGLAVNAVYNTYAHNEAGGSITATANTDNTEYGSATAIAVSMYSYGDNVLVNDGTITANGNGARVAVMSNLFGTASIWNYGTITGSIQTGKYGDYLYNGAGGTWNALQTSYFGYGDDAIVNDGTINMLGSTIDLGKYSSEYGNTFDNEGLINVRGTATINMGGNYGVDAFYTNPSPFYNGGTISFLDGAPDDLLIVVGDFAGHGDLVMDFNGTTHVADKLYIEGDIIEPTVQTVSGNLIAPPTTAYSEIPFAWVFGTSQAGDFTLGTIHSPGDLFYTLGYGIVNHLNVAGSTTDVYSLGVTVTGLSARGVLASSFSPGVQNLWHDGIGTVFQREGTSRDEDETGPVLWLRVFTTDGSIEPEGVTDRNFGGGGSQNFDQKNTGTEFGFAFHFNPQWSAGVLIGKSDADIDPDAGGHGKIKADTYGAYLTWMPGNGFYGDLSYRKMNFDTEATVVGGNWKGNGDADGWSLEMGYGFDTASGWKIEPQVQVSDMTVNMDPIASSWGSFSLDDGDSTRTRLGVSLRKTFSSSDDHSWTPYFALSAVHEDKGDNSFNIAGTFHGESDLRGTSGLFEAGATGQMGQWTVFGGLTYRDGAAYNGVFGGQLGVRYAFGKKAPPPVVAPAPMPAPQKTCADLDDDGDGVNNCNDKCPDSAAGQAIGPDGCPVPLTIDLKGVNFDFDKSTLRPDAVAILDEAVSILTKYPELKVEVAGHTDSIGTEKYNQGLSERRARVVYDYLTGHGIDAGRLAGPNGYGESKPIAPNTNPDGTDNPENRAKNRRTELDVQN